MTRAGAKALEPGTAARRATTLPAAKPIGRDEYDMTERWKVLYGASGKLEVIDGMKDARAAAADGNFQYRLTARATEIGWYGFTFARIDETGAVRTVTTIPVLVWDRSAKVEGAPKGFRPARAGEDRSGVSATISPDPAEVIETMLPPGEKIAVRWTYNPGGEGVAGGWVLVDVTFGNEKPTVPGYSERLRAE